MAYDRASGHGKIALLDVTTTTSALAPPQATVAAGPAARATFPVAASDILTCGNRWLGVGEGVEFRISEEDGRAVDILRSFELADGGGAV